MGEFSKKFRPGEFVFVVDMGDLFGYWVDDEWIQRVIEHVSKFPKTEFLFLTKNPRRYLSFDFPKNAWLGATIETDLDNIYKSNNISRAPPPSERIKAMKELDWDKKFISIEPILLFSRKFPEHILEINPKIVYVGYDNYGNRLPEPTKDVAEWLIKKLEQANIRYVIRKTIRLAWYEDSRGVEFEEPLCAFFNILHLSTVWVNDEPYNLLDYAKLLIGNSRKVTKKFPTENPGTIFKLFFVWRYMNFPYIDYMRGLKRKILKIKENAQIYYIDLFSGSGISEVKIEDKKYYLPGSALFPLLAQQKLIRQNKDLIFDKIILNDLDEVTFNYLKHNVKMTLELLGLEDLYQIRICKNEAICERVLKEVLSDVDSRYILICNLDANNLAKIIVNILKEVTNEKNFGFHALTFIDPSSPYQFYRDALKSILSIPSDVLMLAHIPMTDELFWKWRGITDSSRREQLLERVKKTLGETKFKQVYSEIKRPSEAYKEMLEEVAMESKILFLNEARIPIPISIKTEKKEYFVYAFIRSGLWAKYKSLTEKSKTKKLPSKIQWISFLIRQKKIFSRASMIGKHVQKMLEGKYISLTGRICM